MCRRCPGDTSQTISRAWGARTRTGLHASPSPSLVLPSGRLGTFQQKVEIARPLLERFARLEQALCEWDHVAGLGPTQVTGIEIEESDAIQPIGIFQERGQCPVRVVPSQFIGPGVERHGCRDGGVVRAPDARLSKKRANLRHSLQTPYRSSPMNIAAPVMSSGQVVEIHSRPEAEPLFLQAGGLDQPKRVHHDSANMASAPDRGLHTVRTRRHARPGVAPGNCRSRDGWPPVILATSPGDFS